MTPISFSPRQKSYVQEFWQRRAKLDPCQIVTTRLHDTDAHVHDLRFLLPAIKPGCRVLDMGAGSGILAKAVAEIADHVLAVDPFPEFYADQYRAPNITVAAGDLHTFTTHERFDVAIVFGVMQHVDGASRLEVYGRMRDLLVDGGLFITRHACGVEDDVFVDHHSDQLNTHYVAFYPHLSQELQTLESLFAEVRVTDIYPPHLNRWQNTHYHAFSCLKGSAR